MRVVSWTHRARSDLEAIRAFIAQDSPHYAGLVAGRIVAAADRLSSFPESGREVPEVAHRDVRELIVRPYRIVYRLVGDDQVHILTIHHGTRMFPRDL